MPCVKLKIKVTVYFDSVICLLRLTKIIISSSLESVTYIKMKDPKSYFTSESQKDVASLSHNFDKIY